MRKFLLILFVLFAVPCFAQTWNTLPVDFVIGMNTSTPGTALTSAILNAGTTFNPAMSFGTISIPGPGVFAVGANQGHCGNIGPVSVNGTSTTFASQQLNYNSIQLNDQFAVNTSPSGFVTMAAGGAARGQHVMAITMCMYIGPPSTSGSGNDWDRWIMNAGGPNGEYADIQFAQQGGCNQFGAPPAGYICVRTEGKPTSHSGYFYLQPQHSYWFVDWWNDSSGTVNGQPAGTQLLHIYTEDGTPVPCMTSVGSPGCTTLTANGNIAADIISNQTAVLTSGFSGSGMDHFIFGNFEAGFNAGTFSYFQNLMFSYTNAPFPLFWLQTADPWAPANNSGTLVLAPSRGVSWQNAGVVGGIPARTSPVCATEAAGTPSSTINTAAAACSGSGGGVVNLAAGSYSGTLSLANNVTIRGAGANQTIFTSTGNWNLTSGASPGNNLTTWTPGGGVGGANPFTLTQPWPAGINTVTLASSTNLKVGSLIVFDQLDQAIDYGDILVTQSTTALTAVAPGVAGAYVSQGDAQGVSRGTCNGALSTCFSQQQSALVTQCDGVSTPGHACASGANITINPPLVMPNWGYDLGGNSLSPGAWYSSNLPTQNAGLEDIGIDMSSCSGCVVTMRGGYNDWTKGVAIVNESPGNTGTINTPYSLNLSIPNNYIGPTSVSGTGVYGINAQYCNFCRIENNIVHAVPTPFMFNGGGVGNVWGYNFAVGGFYTGSSQYNIPAFGDHAAGIAKNLFEGNETNGYSADSIHGVSDFQTLYRNNFWGTYPSCWQSGSTEQTSIYAICTQNMTPVSDSAGHRLLSSLGNVLGTTGVEALYTTTSFASGSGPYAIYQYGSQTVSVADSSNLQQTAAIWGNADAVTGFGSPRFNCNEMSKGTAWDAYGATIGAWQQERFYNPCPSTHTLPASFYYTSTPAWWPAGKPFPPVGPDVTGGNLLLCTSGTQARALVTSATASACTSAGGTTSVAFAGLAYSIPAMDCFLSLGGNPNGTGGPLTNFNESCYTSSSPPQAAAPICTTGISPFGSGTYTTTLNVTCSDTSPGTVICYNFGSGTTPATNGGAGCSNGTLYSTGIPILSSSTLNVIAGGSGYTDSSVVTYIYTLVLSISPPATPMFAMIGILK